MPKVTVRTTIGQEMLAAGDVLTGQLWINPASSRGPKSSPPRVNNISVAATCRVRAEWQEENEEKRRGEAVVYRVEKPLIAAPIEVGGPKVFDFKIVLPTVAQRTATSWNRSRDFEHAAGHEIPPTVSGVVEHLLEVEVSTEGGLFRGSRQTREMPYVFVKTRRHQHPDPEMQIESRHLSHQLHGSVRKILAWRPDVPTSSSDREDPAGRRDPSSGSAAYFVTASLPGRLHIGGGLPIELTARPGRSLSPDGQPPKVYLRAVTVNVVSHSALRIKLAENTRAVDPEKDSKSSFRHRMKHAKDLNLCIEEPTRIDQVLTDTCVLAPAGVPSFRTYNAARTYVLELWITTSIEDKLYDLAFTRKVHIDSGYYQPQPSRQLPPIAGSSEQNTTSTTSQTEGDRREQSEDGFLPPYSGPPPAYNDNADNRLSLVTQARTQGVDIIDLL